ncbi:MAG: histidine phosphatase family protein [Erysipelotrichia bacterium]|nr:histidine phosphatase family protein [Erysipelotrichia bacterium]
MKPLYLYITRHGQTVYNTTNIVQGYNDSALTKLGIYQGRCVGYGLRNIKFDKAYSGNIARQYKTAQLILEENLYGQETKLIIDERLKEMGYGTYQGKPYEVMLKPIFERINIPYGDFEKLEETLSPAQIGKMLNEHNKTVEKYDVLCTRVKQAIEQIVDDNKEGGNVLIATSSCALDALIDVLFPKLEKRKGLVSNCCICLIRYEKNNFYLDKFNDISYRIEGENYYNEKNIG